MADMMHNHLLEYIHAYDDNFEILRTVGNTVEKVLNLLKHHNVCMFLYRQHTKTGAYYICKGFTGPIVLAKVNSNCETCINHDAKSCLYGTYGQSFDIFYDMYDPTLDLDNSKTPKRFVRHLKRRLFDDPASFSPKSIIT